MINALLAHSFRAADMSIPWQVVPVVVGALAALAVVFCGVYKLTGMFMPSGEIG